MGKPDENGWQETAFGHVPEDWGIKPLSECAVVQTGVTKGRKLNAEEAVSVPYLRVANVQDGYLDLSEMKEIEIRRSELTRYSLEAGDVVLTEGGDFDKLGRGFIWNGEVAGCVHQNHIFAVRPRKDTLLPEFLAYLTQSPYGKAYFLSVAHKTTNLACINTTKLKAFPALLPPIPEQRAIAHVLRTVQQAKEATEKVIAAARQLKQSLMRHLFTYGPVPVDKADKVVLKETEIGQVPEHWQQVKLIELLREPLRNGHSAKATNTTDGIRTLILTAVTKNDFSIDNTKLTTADAERVRDMWLASGDIFIERANTAELVGLAALYEGPSDFAIFPDLLVRVRVKTAEVTPKYLAEFLLAEPCRAYYRSNAKATAGNFPKIDQGIIEQTPVSLPPMAEQVEIARCLSALDKKIHSESNRRNALESLFSSLLHHLMTGQVRVNHWKLPAEVAP